MEIVEKADEGNGKEVENRRKRRIKNRKEDEGMDEAMLVLASVITRKKEKTNKKKQNDDRISRRKQRKISVGLFTTKPLKFSKSFFIQYPDPISPPEIPIYF